MSVPAGYKATEAGVIPKDWDAVPLGSLFTFKNGLNKAKQFFGHGTPIVNYMDVFRYPALQMTMVAGRVEVNKAELDSYSVRQGDVFFTRTSETVEEVGIASTMLDAAENTVFSGFVLRARPKGDDLVDEFKAYAFRSEAVRNQIIAKATYTTRALTNGGALSAIYLAKPTKPEQSAIAEALSDVDEAIAAQEAVILKKRALKTATMQALLSGTRRLPDFSAEWEVKALGKCLKVRHGKSQAAVESVNGKYPILATGGEIGRADAYLHPGPSVLIGRKGTIDRPQYSEGPFWSIDTLFYTEVDASADAKFLFYKFQMIDWRAFNEASGVPSLSSTTIETIEVAMPKRDEQTAIAAVISDFDLDLNQNEAKLAKLQNLKTGMMQQLLTGKIRLL